MRLFFMLERAFYRFFTASEFRPIISPAKGPLGKATITSNILASTVNGTRTECEHNRPQLNPDAA
jgi:hypothetical protein